MSQAAPPPPRLAPLAIKVLALLVVFNLLFAALDPMPALGKISLYNLLFPGRERLPFGENPAEAYNFSLYDLEAMYRSHRVAAPKAPGEIRIVLIGDSATWGYLLRNEETLASALQARLTRAPGLEGARVYNLGYPTITLTKDLLLLEMARRADADLILWLTTLEAFPRSKQLESPILQNNAPAVQALISQYGLELDPADPRLVAPDFWQRTLFGQRRPLADLLRLQLYGPLWAATGVDHSIPAVYDPPQSDLEADESFQQLQPPALQEADLSWDALEAGLRMAGETPVLLVNEPIFISQGENSQVRYNLLYPRWAYDQYRRQMAERAAAGGWRYLDAWDVVPAELFTNSAIHFNAVGEALLADFLFPAVQEALAAP